MLGRVLRVCTRMVARAFACEAARAATVRPRARKSAHLRPRALPVAGRVTASQARRRARRVRPGARASGRDMITVSMVRVRMRVADPVAIHEDSIRLLWLLWKRSDRWLEGRRHFAGGAFPGPTSPPLSVVQPFQQGVHSSPLWHRAGQP